ncbi:MAG: ATP-binding protein [Candidatus Scalindua sp. AMX11]|nr:MAG: ATP-binding protein [Candidatus Scalindua sp.]NOG84802.1 ATP-binding protein [Planctomycetota bacterium]RZV98402.1 MAG: ATP-binding protein [Candidatus Scalindua sp. SCAELEC01]TDE66502.1 MAG: ATP-binding protein [Candidatus Scalindua sp. AMX11]GJQ58865.1 MAG: ATPase [Candidatus Scalindua sp.]
MIDRTLETTLKELSTKYPVVTVTGPRQSGKTTLCRKVFPKKDYVNLENIDIRQFAIDDPRGFLRNRPDGAILDEIQRTPDLLSYIQPIVDDTQRDGLFVLTGSQQFEVSSKISQSLAGRTALLKLLPFSIEELSGHYDIASINRMVITGFYPRIYDKELNPTTALGDYFETYVERDLRLLVNIKDLNLFQKFVRLCAGRVGQILNLKNLANDVGISHTTARSWTTLLEASYIIFLLQPYFSNISKRLIKSPKLYFYDIGLASYLIGLESELHASRDPLRGNLFENMVVIEALKYRLHRGRRNNLCFYRDSGGNEVDMVVTMGPNLFPVEIKAGETVTDEFFKGLRTFKKTFPKNTPLNSGLIYGGNSIQMRSDVMIYPATGVHTMLESLENK